MWAAVRERFRQFHSDLGLTRAQIDDGLTKQKSVRQTLQAGYYGRLSDEPPGFMVGSWGKGTQVRPPRDVDVFFPLPDEVFHRFEGYSGNRQSALLQEVKRVLEDSFWQTEMRGDGQVVVIDFYSITVEVVPVFRSTSPGQFIMPDTNSGGRWKVVDPFAEQNLIDVGDAMTNGNLRPMAQMLKVWKRERNVPLKSYQLEILERKASWFRACIRHVQKPLLFLYLQEVVHARRLFFGSTRARARRV